MMILTNFKCEWKDLNSCSVSDEYVRNISCGHTRDFYLGKTDLPRANSSKIYLGKFISGFVLPR